MLSQPQAIPALEELNSCKILMTPSGIEPSAQFPIQLRHPVPTSIYVHALMLTNLCHLIQRVRRPTMRACRRLSVLTIRLVRLGTAVKEFQTPLPSLTPRHPQRTTYGYGKEIDTGNNMKLVAYNHQ